MPIFLLLLVAMIVEITVLVLVGQAIGILPTILVLILTSVVGIWLMRREGTRTFVAFQEAAKARRVPAKEMIDGVLIAGAGVLILIPGFVSDALALFLLFPPTRSLISGRMAVRAEQQVRSAQFGGTFVVDSVVVDDDFDNPGPADPGRIERPR